MTSGFSRHRLQPAGRDDAQDVPAVFRRSCSSSLQCLRSGLPSVKRPGAPGRLPATNQRVMGRGSPVTPARNGGSELVLNQRKRVGRLRLLITRAGRHHHLSHRGRRHRVRGTHDPSPADSPGPEICKVAAGDVMPPAPSASRSRAGTEPSRCPSAAAACRSRWTGRYGRRDRGCSVPGSPSTRSPPSPVRTAPALSSNTAARTARVSIVAGGVSNQTIVTFANKVTPKGFLEVCKAKPNG